MHDCDYYECDTSAQDIRAPVTRIHLIQLLFRFLVGFSQSHVKQPERE